MTKKYTVLLLILMCFFLKALYGIEDRSIAIVGNRIIWNNDVKERAQIRGISYEKALLELIEEKLLIIQAKKENIPVSKEEIDARFNFIVDEWEKNGFDFIRFIRNNGLTVDQYKEILGEEIQKEKLISQKITAKIKLSPVEISKRMAQLPQEKQILLLRKVFDDSTSAESFVQDFKKNKKLAQEMEPTEWIEISRIDPNFLTELYSAGRENPIIRKQSGKFIVYVFAQELDNSPAERYKRAYQELRQEKFVKAYAEYLDSLAKNIPIKIFDQDIAKKFSVQ